MGDTREATRPEPAPETTPAAAAADAAAIARREEADPIAEALQTLFRSTEAEPLPDRFKDLLDRLAAEDEAGS